jgi:hypothetical protein
LATMPSADFCLIINKVALIDAIGFITFAPLS